MVGIALLLAQCTPGVRDCDLPRTLPWYFGLAIAAAWLATVIGVVLLLRRRLATRRAERREKRRAVEPARGTDVDVW